MLKDLGEKPPKAEMMSTSKVKWYPNVTVDAEDFPGLVGDKCKMEQDRIATLKVRKTGERSVTGRDGKKTTKIDLELRGMDLPKDEPRSIEAARRKLIAENKE
jgi:hypothetical protein